MEYVDSSDWAWPGRWIEHFLLQVTSSTYCKYISLQIGQLDATKATLKPADGGEPPPPPWQIHFSDEYQRLGYGAKEARLRDTLYRNPRIRDSYSMLVLWGLTGRICLDVQPSAFDR